MCITVSLDLSLRLKLDIVSEMFMHLCISNISIHESNNLNKAHILVEFSFHLKLKYFRLHFGNNDIF